MTYGKIKSSAPTKITAIVCGNELPKQDPTITSSYSYYLWMNDEKVIADPSKDLPEQFFVTYPVGASDACVLIFRSLTTYEYFTDKLLTSPLLANSSPMISLTTDKAGAIDLTQPMTLKAL